ncbi:MAG TPA: hypothetical protein PLT66_00485 [Bacillota bacterium]|nr:hypothetical protein [Bacillota bacterium]
MVSTLDGVLCSMPVSDLLMFILSAAVIIYTQKTLIDDAKEQ